MRNKYSKQLAILLAGLTVLTGCGQQNGGEAAGTVFMEEESRDGLSGSEPTESEAAAGSRAEGVRGQAGSPDSEKNAERVGSPDSVFPNGQDRQQDEDRQTLIVGAESLEEYLPLLEGKRVGLTANRTSRAGGMHELDFLLENGVHVAKIFAPEHGFRTDAQAGEQVSDERDEKTGLPIVSLYGSTRKPTAEQLEGIDVMIYDIQDVGVRFFTYISTMHYVMESCAEQHIPVIVLDRPNPNIDYVAGYIREENVRSFVGLDPIPVVYGMTQGELAQMINGEGWLENGITCELTVIPVKNYTRSTKYELPVSPSPNLASSEAVRLYPSLCLFEAACVSVGRGTDDPFTAVGYPDERFGAYVFTPEDMPGRAVNPLYEGQRCYGVDYRKEDMSGECFTVRYFVEMYREFQDYGMEMVDRAEWLALLWGNDRLLNQIRSGMTVEEIEAGWKEDVEKFREQRAPYLIYAE